MTTHASGRNDPCSCGSGKKFKKCCGQHTTPSTSRATKKPAELIQEGANLHQAGLLELAEDAYRQALAIQKNNVDALNLLGVLCHQTGRSEEGGMLVQQAVKLKPDHLDAVTNLGNILRDVGHLDSAIGCYEHAISVNAKHALSRSNLGSTLSAAGRSQEAIPHLERALAIDPNLHDAHFNLGEALERLGRFAEAIPHYQTFLAHAPQHPMARLNLADSLKNDGQLGAATQLYRQLIQELPGFILAHNNLANLLRAEGQLTEAEQLFRQALQHMPNLAELHSNLAAVLISQNRIDEALEHLNYALTSSTDSTNNTAAYNNMSAALLAKNRVDDALAYLDKAMSATPQQAEIHYLKGLALLVQGRLAEGFKEYEWRWGCHLFKSSRVHLGLPRWQGEPLAGRTLLVHAEQGLGDTLQFARYVPQLRQIAGDSGRIIFECPAAAISILQPLGGFDEIRPTSQEHAGIDVQIPLLSLPTLFGTDIDNVPAPIPYLHANPARITLWQEKLTASGTADIRIGIAWAGNKEHANDRNRSTQLEAFAPLAAIPGVQLISLQKGQGEDEARHPPSGISIQPWGETLEDYQDTAALIEALDLVICVDTSVAHLAGALGKPVWALLAHSPDWRWMMERSDSPWYPSMRLFRQKNAGDWAGVMAEVCQALPGFIQDSIGAKPH